MEQLFGYIFAPVAWLLGVSWNDCASIGRLLGERLVTNEFIAFIDLGKIRNQLDPHSFTIATYALCGALGGLDGAMLAGYFRGANVDIGNEYLLLSIAVVVIGGTSVAGGKANIPGVWGGALFLVLLQTMLNTFGVSAGVRLLLTGLIIVAVITAAGGPKAR